MSKKRPSGTWPELAKQLGMTLQRLRVERGLSQEQVAYAAGVSRATYQKFERGEAQHELPANPSLRNTMAVAQVLGVGLDDLLPPPWPDLTAGAPVRSHDAPR